jgi:hypothetical protein
LQSGELHLLLRQEQAFDLSQKYKEVRFLQAGSLRCERGEDCDRMSFRPFHSNMQGKFIIEKLKMMAEF